MKRALVTGATGMLGGYVVERFLAEGWDVRALVRDPSRNGGLARLGLEAVVGDLTHADALRAAARGCDAIVHAAAAIGAGGDWAAFRATNVAGTANVVAAAEDSDCRLVHVSSTSVFGRERYYAFPTDETVPLPLLPDTDAYGRSKQEAERVVLAAHARGRVWASVVRPPMMYGKGDRQFVPRVARALAAGVFPLVAGGRNTLALVHARSVADGAVRAALTTAAGGRVYHLANDFAITVADLVRLAADGLGRRVRTPRVPLAIARLAGGALAAGLAVGGRRDLALHAPGLLDMLTRDNPFTSERARRELAWSPVIAPAAGLPEAFAWWRERARSAAEGTP